MAESRSWQQANQVRNAKKIAFVLDLLPNYFFSIVTLCFELQFLKGDKTRRCTFAVGTKDKLERIEVVGLRAGGTPTPQELDCFLTDNLNALGLADLCR